MPLEILSDAAVRRLDIWPVVRDAVREALVAAAEERANNAPVARLEACGGAVNVKAGAVRVGDEALIGLKAGTYWPGNAARGQPNHGAATLLLHAGTGQPRALVAAPSLNRWRTAAADVWAVQTLARPEARCVAVIGTGAQAEFEVRALAQERSLAMLLIGARTPAAGEALARRLDDVPTPKRVCSPSEAAQGADIILCATSAREAVLGALDVCPGAHISAMGADAVGKRELAPDLLALCTPFADQSAQALQIGELQHLPPERQREVSALGAVLTGQAPGRRTDSEITLFDSSGLAAQDLLAAEAVLSLARSQGLVKRVEF